MQLKSLFQKNIFSKIRERAIASGDKAIAALARRFSPGIPPGTGLADYGSYMVDASLVNADSIVYSFGVGGNIYFDDAISEAKGCHVYMFDPTPPALNFLKTKALSPLLTFDPVGVWTETGSFKFYTDGKAETEQKRNFSVTNFFQVGTYIEASCMTLPDIMKKYGHDRIDLLKMDIEGAAIDVLSGMLKQGIYPAQVVGEIEIPKLRYHAGPFAIIQGIRQKAALLRALENSGYTLSTYGKAEFTAVRRA